MKKKKTMKLEVPEKKKIKVNPRAGRTRRLGPVKQKELLLKCLKETMGIVTFACEMAGISVPVYYGHYNSDPIFKAECDAINDANIDIVENQLYKNILSGDITSTIFFLKTKARHRGYAEKIENYHTIESIIIKPYEQIQGDSGSTPLLQPGE